MTKSSTLCLPGVVSRAEKERISKQVFELHLSGALLVELGVLGDHHFLDYGRVIYQKKGLENVEELNGVLGIVEGQRLL